MSYEASSRGFIQPQSTIAEAYHEGPEAAVQKALSDAATDLQLRSAEALITYQPEVAEEIIARNLARFSHTLPPAKILGQ